MVTRVIKHESSRSKCNELNNEWQTKYNINLLQTTLFEFAILSFMLASYIRQLLLSAFNYNSTLYIVAIVKTFIDIKLLYNYKCHLYMYIRNITQGTVYIDIISCRIVQLAI